MGLSIPDFPGLLILILPLAGLMVPFPRKDATSTAIGMHLAHPGIILASMN
jgi:hypothetical protein